MKPEELRGACEEALAAGREAITVVFPSCFKPWKSFPRGELLCVNNEGEKVMRMSAQKLLDWLKRAMEAARLAA